MFFNREKNKNVSGIQYFSSKREISICNLFEGVSLSSLSDAFENYLFHAVNVLEQTLPLKTLTEGTLK